MRRILLLLPTKSYQAKDFTDAAARLGVDVVIGSEEESVLAGQNPGGLLTLNLSHPEEAARQAAEYAKRYPIHAVVGVDDRSSVVAATIAAALGLPHNSIESASAAGNKHRMHELLDRSGVPSPDYRLFSLDQDPKMLADLVDYPCVLKPTFLAASRGVMRANDPEEFMAAHGRIERILTDPDVIAEGGAAARQLLVETYIPGVEVAVEGILIRGQLHVLAVFDKPDPMEGPTFEETIYVTPSRLPLEAQLELADCTGRAAAALGLREGPVHAEARFNERGPWVIEIAARSIGGLCSRVLRFGASLSLEDLVLRHAVGLELESLDREQRAAGVMMIPIPRAGVLRDIRGLEEAQSVPNIENIQISAHISQKLAPPPEGTQYLGFIFSRADSSLEVEAALRMAHARLGIVIDQS